MAYVYSCMCRANNEEQLKSEAPPVADTDVEAKLSTPSDAELKAKRHGFDYSKPMTVHTLSCSPTHSRESSFRNAKSESMIPQLVVQKKNSSSPPPDDAFKEGKSSDANLALTASLSDVGALSRDAAQKSRHHRKQSSPDSAQSVSQHSASVSALEHLPDSQTNLTEPETKAPSRLKLSISELTKNAFKSLRKPSLESSKSAAVQEPVKRPRSKTVAQAVAFSKRRDSEQENTPEPSSDASPRKGKSVMAMPSFAMEDPIDEELTEIEISRRGRAAGTLKHSKSLECLDTRDEDLPPLRRGGALTPPPTGCAPLALLRPKPRPRASTNIGRLKKPRIVVEPRSVSPTSWDYSNGAPPALPVIQNAAAGISTPPTTLSRNRDHSDEAKPAPTAPAPALPTSIPPPLALDKRPLPMPVPRKSRKNITPGSANTAAPETSSLEKVATEDGDKDACDAYEKVHVKSKHKINFTHVCSCISSYVQKQH